VLTVVAVALFFFLRAVFSGNLIVREYIFRIGNFELKWYSVMIATGILVSYFLGRKRLSNYPIKPEDLDEGLFWGIIAGILGARIYYVAFNWSYYSMYPSEIWKVWHGGLAIHGAVFAVLLTLFIYAKVKGYFKFVHATDLFTSVLPLGQAIGRWGNFFNYEAYGRPTMVPWKMFVPPEKRMPGFDVDSTFIRHSFTKACGISVSLFSSSSMLKNGKSRMARRQHCTSYFTQLEDFGLNL